MAMMSCWEYEPDERPSFSTLVDSLSQYLETMAEYMDVGGSLSKSLKARETAIEPELKTISEQVGNNVEQNETQYEDALDLPEVKVLSPNIVNNETHF